MWILLASIALGAPTAVTAGSGHSCFVRSDETVWCWGGQTPDALRAGEPPPHPEPWQVPELDRVLQVDAGGELRSCAVREDRTVWCWTLTEAPAPVDGLHADQVSVGEAHVCALDAGKVWCWGYNAKGQLGDGSTVDRKAPVPVAGITDVVELVAGWYHSCARTRNGSVWCWGMGSSGQLGRGDLADHPEPAPVRYLEDAVALDAGSSNTCAVRADGQVLCWGAGRVGQLGTGGRQDTAAITAVPGMDRAVDVAVGLDHVCAVTRTGAVHCWGNNEAGQLGMDLPKGHQLVPQEVEGLSGVRAVSAGSQHTCVLLAGGGVRCFGQNFTGQLGDGTTDKRMRPVVVVP